MINFFKEDIQFRLTAKEQVVKWLLNVISKEGFKAGEVNYIFCNDKYLRKINKDYLQHNYNTDIVTFDNSGDKKIISGDIFISVDRVRENAMAYETRFSNELHRVMVHGLLHLAGYDDKNSRKQDEMRQREDYWLKKFQPR
jgi:probable rRNA maturation factor